MKQRKIISLMLSLLLVISIFAGCGGSSQTQQPAGSASQAAAQSAPPADYSNMTIEEQMAEDAKNPITFTVTFPSDTPPDQDGPLMLEFAKRTGVTFDLNPIPGEPYEKLGMMLASNSLSDIMVVPNEQISNQYKKSGQIIDMLPYLKRSAPTVYDMYTSDANHNLLDNYMEPDGRLLYIMNDVDMVWSADEPYENPNHERDFVWLPWMTSLYVLYPEIDEYAGDKITSLDEWYNAMVAYKTANPQNYPTSMSNEYGEWMLYSFATLYGYKVEQMSGANFITKDDENYQSIARMPEAIESLKFLNKLYKEGLMDPEGPIQSTDTFLEKMSSGRVFSFLGYYDKIYEANDAFASEEDWDYQAFIPQKMQAPGVTKTWQSNIAYSGYQCTMVTTSCPDTDRFFRVLEYEYSDEGLMLNNWGIEGEHYELDANNEPTFFFDVETEWESMAKQGFDFFQTFLNQPNQLRDGRWARYDKNPDYPLNSFQTHIKGTKYNYFQYYQGDYWFDASTQNLMLSDNEEAILTAAKIRTPINDMVCKAIVANSDSEIEKIYSDTINQIELDGLVEFEKAVKAVVDERRK